jgi:hypothetical protein
MRAEKLINVLTYITHYLQKQKKYNIENIMYYDEINRL